MSTYTIKIDAFEGPFDLLFHLIEKNKFDIYDIPISQIADQYLDYIAEMQQMDLEVASEFLVMASTLLHIKSRLLLPAPRGGEDEAEADPKEQLIANMIEYKRYKEFSASLRGMAAYWGGAYYRLAGLAFADGSVAFMEGAAEVPSGIKNAAGGIENAAGGVEITADGNGSAAGMDGAENASDGGGGGFFDGFAPFNRNVEQLSLFDMDRGRLISIYRGLLDARRRRHENVAPTVKRIVERDIVTLGRKIRQIVNYLLVKPRFLFQKLFNPKNTPKMDIIMGFTALLELSQQNRVTLRQKKQFGGLLVSRKERKAT